MDAAVAGLVGVAIGGMGNYLIQRATQNALRREARRSEKREAYALLMAGLSELTHELRELASAYERDAPWEELNALTKQVAGAHTKWQQATALAYLSGGKEVRMVIESMTDTPDAPGPQFARAWKEALEEHYQQFVAAIDTELAG